MLEPAARTAGVRVLAVDRPGYGDSDDQKGRTIPDWPAEVAALADHLHLARFAVVGVSGGAPYALARASRIPERISACALGCPLGPVYLPQVLAAMAWPARINLDLARRLPEFSRSAALAIVAAILARRPGSVERLRTLTAPPSDRAELAQARTRAILARTVADAMRGGAPGANRDLTLYTRPWGISIEGIEGPIDLWHGGADGIVPSAHTPWYETHLESRRARYFPGEGPFSLPLRYAPAILAALRAGA